MTALPAVIVIAGVSYVLASASSTPVVVSPPFYPPYPPNPTPPVDQGVGTMGADVASKVDALLRAGGARLSSMTDGEKRSAANALNTQLGISPPLTGSEDWSTIVGAATGAGASTACSAIPGVGDAIAATGLCAIAGTYLGVHLEDFLAGALDQGLAYLQSVVPGFISSAVGDTVDEIKSWFHSLF